MVPDKMKNLFLLLALYGACGFKPFPPFGCSNNDAVCVCDSSGECNWVWVCSK